MASAANQYALATSGILKQRLEMKLMRHAMYVMSLDPTPTDGSLDIAKRVIGMNMGGGGDFAGRMAKIVAQEPSLDAKAAADVSGAEITDADLEQSVATHFLKLA